MPKGFKYVTVEEVGKQMVTETTHIPPTDGIAGGVSITGFIDVEKLIYTRVFYKSYFCVKTLFLEKKLPFSYLILSIDPPAEDAQ